MTMVDPVSDAAPAHIRVIRTLPELEAFIPEWNDFLARSAARHSVYQTPSYVHSVIARSPKSEPCVVVVGDANGIAVRGWLRSYLLMTNSGPIAYGLGFQYQGTRYWDETAYAQECARFSPGSILTHRVIADLFLHDTPELLDFGQGDGGYKRTFGNDRIETCSAHLVKTALAAGVTNLQLAMNRSEARVRQVLGQLRLTEYARRILKRRNATPSVTVGAPAGGS